MTQLSERFVEAVRYAAELHRTQARKGTDVPYISHLLGVVSFVLEAGGGEDEAIAALLHDAAEDHGGRARLDDIRDRFGPTVAHIVEGCTDSWSTPKEPWMARKERYVEHAKKLDRETLRVSAADKVHNAYTILRDLRTLGDVVWKRFNTSPDDVIWYYDALVRSYRDSGSEPLVDELERVVRGIKREMGY